MSNERPRTPQNVRQRIQWWVHVRRPQGGEACEAPGRADEYLLDEYDIDGDQAPYRRQQHQLWRAHTDVQVISPEEEPDDKPPVYRGVHHCRNNDAYGVGVQHLVCVRSETPRHRLSIYFSRPRHPQTVSILTMVASTESTCISVCLYILLKY